MGWRVRCSSGFWPWLNMMWEWRLRYCRLVCRLPLWFTLYGFLSYGVWWFILWRCRWPCCIGEPRACGWINMCIFPLISLIPWNRCPISFSISLVHFYFSSPFIRYLYSWGFTVCGKMTTFIWPGWIVISTVVLLVFIQSSTFLCIVYA